MAFSPHGCYESRGWYGFFTLGLIWIFAIFRVIRLSRYAVLIRAWKSCVYRICKSTYFLVNIWATTWQNQQNECAPSEDSDQPGHPPSLIGVFAVCMKKAWALSYPLSANEDFDQTGWMPRLIWIFAGHTLTLLVLSCRGSYDKGGCLMKI